MPIESKLTRAGTLESEPLAPIKAGSYKRIDFDHAAMHVFCRPIDDIGVIRFSGVVGDLTVEVDNELRTVEPDEIFEVKNDQSILICDDSKAIVLRHSNILTTFQKEVSADQT